MRHVTKITVWQKTLPLKTPYWLSGGRLKFESLDSTFVKVECADGSFGWGEGCPWGHTYLPASGPSLRGALEVIAPALIGETADDIERLNMLMDVTLPGHPFAKSPLDIALWDIRGKVSGLPLFRLLGGAYGDAVEVNSSISTGTPEEMIAAIERARAKGYRYHSAKVGGADPKTDIERIDAIEANTLPGEVVTFDVNRAWKPGVAIEVMNSVSAGGWFEQPCETLDECDLVARQVRQPLMLDECMHSLADHREAWRKHVGAGAKVKPNRLGGITKAKQVRDFCVDIGWQMHIEDTGGSILADTAAFHLAYSTPVDARLGSWLCHDHLVDDFAEGSGARNEAGFVKLTESPGVGLEPPPAFLGTPVAEYG